MTHGREGDLATMVELDPAFPQWTEIGQDSGLDPLGMQRPIEVLFQSLLAGVSTITLRLRYYSFFAWLLEVYAKSNRKNDPREFNVFHRRAEVLLALASARDGHELGVTGIDWASRQLTSIQDSDQADHIIRFDEAADPDTPPEQRYLRNKSGAFGAIYSTQMAEMGLVELDDEKLGLPYCTNAALPLAAGFAEATAQASDTFLEVLDRGEVSLTQLDELASFLPSRIEASSAEQSSLADALLGRIGDPSDGNTARRETIKLLLAQADELGQRPKTDELKWAFFDLADRPGGELSSEVCEAWSLYQACDLCRLAYEALLTAALVAVRSGPGSRLSIDRAVEDLILRADVSDKLTFGEFLNNAGADRTTRENTEAMLAAHKSGDITSMVRAAVVLIAQLFRRSREFSPEVLAWLNVDAYFQSLVSEVQFFNSLMEKPASIAIAKIISERVIKRHLWVASRKLKNKAYTFLIEPDDGVLRYREDFRVSPSSPRLDQAIQFLDDCKLLNGEGITPLGREELAKQ